MRVMSLLSALPVRTRLSVSVPHGITWDKFLTPIGNARLARRNDRQRWKFDHSCVISARNVQALSVSARRVLAICPIESRESSRRRGGGNPPRIRTRFVRAWDISSEHFYPFRSRFAGRHEIAGIPAEIRNSHPASIFHDDGEETPRGFLETPG